MKYIKLFLPIPLFLLLIFLSEQYMRDTLDVGKYFLKAGLFIYYLKLDNKGTPLINTLTIILLIMVFGEYLLSKYSTVGQIIFIISYIAFGLLYSLRQKLKETKDKLSKIKIVAVLIFVLTNIIQIGLNTNFIFVAVGAFILASVYLYDRLLFKL